MSTRDKLQSFKDPIRVLFNREIGGRHKSVKHGASPQVFQKLPGRLAFNLTSLVDSATLQDGHVFLGFTKNGQFLISYTHCVEADEHTACPAYVYRMQWWRFVPYRRLRKVAEVRLFGDEEIQQDVFIIVCEWPHDNSRILIHGYCAPNANEEKHQCYITVTAVPAIEPCEDCNQLAILHMHNRYQYEAPPRCLNHAFTVHSKYELAPPYPSFCPRVFLKLDSVVVVNTGDSLIALSADIEDNHGGFGFGLFSPRVARTFSSISSIGSPSEDQLSVDSHEPRVVCESAREHLDLLGKFIASSPNSNLTVYRSPPTPKDTTNTPSTQVNCGESRTTLTRDRSSTIAHGKENQNKESVLYRNVGSPPTAMDNSPCHKSVQDNAKNSSLSMDVYNFEASTPTPTKKEEELNESTGTAIGSPNPGTASTTRTVRTSLTFPPEGAHMRVQGHTSHEEISLQSDANESSQSLTGSDLPQSRDASTFEKPQMLPSRHANKDLTHTPTKSFGSLSLIPPSATESFSLVKGLCSPPGSTCSSCISAPIILTSDSQCFTYSVRRYVEAFSAQDVAMDFEDDLNLAYHSVLPLEVHGAHNCNMRILTKQCPAPQMPCIVVKQLTLDIEHYLGEAVRTKADWGNRYLSFTNYDVQIIDVCPETSEVIALVYVLIRARPPRDKTKPYIHGRSVPRLYQSGLKLVWNLRTGAYNTLDIEELEEVNQADFMRRRKQWHPGSKVCEQLYRKYAVPQLFSNSVHTLTNEPVFKGQSLKMLLDRQNYVAVLL